MRLVCLSDTHCYHPEVPDGDILIHAGDICNSGKRGQLETELTWLSTLPHKVKYFVPGNHDKSVDVMREYFRAYCSERGIQVLVDTTVQICDPDTGHCFYLHGHPWTPLYGSTAGFMRERHLLGEYVKRIPKCDILVSHGPPAGIFDRIPYGTPIGCQDLWRRVKRIQPRVHIFGHNHWEHGKQGDHEWVETGNSTFFANLAYCRSNPKEPAGDTILVLDITWDNGILNVENRSS